MSHLNLVPFPDIYSDIEKQLRMLADEVAAGEFGPDPYVVCVTLTGAGIDVRGMGKTDNMISMATLNLALTWLAQQTLARIEE